MITVRDFFLGKLHLFIVRSDMEGDRAIFRSGPFSIERFRRVEEVDLGMLLFTPAVFFTGHRCCRHEAIPDVYSTYSIILPCDIIFTK